MATFLEVGEDDKEGSYNPYNYLTQTIPLHVNDRCQQYLMGRQIDDMPTSRREPTHLTVADTERQENSRTPGGAGLMHA